MLEKKYHSYEINDELIIDNPHLWDVENPYLYTSKIKIAGQEESLRFGIRGIELSKEQGLLINGNRAILYGACIHSDNALKSLVITP